MAKEMLPVIEKMLGFFLSRLDGDGLFKTVSEEGIWHFYEWAGALDGAFFELDGSKKYRNEYDSLINAFLSIALDNTAKLFSVTGEYDKAIYYQDIRIKLNKSLKEKFYSPETGLFRTYSDREEYSELSNALCVLAEACSDEEAKAIVEKLAVGYDGWVRNTLSMSIFRYDALLKTDREKYVPAILKDIDETYGYMLDNGATSFWETIKGEADFHNAGFPLSRVERATRLLLPYFRVVRGKGKARRRGVFRTGYLLPDGVCGRRFGVCKRPGGRVPGR